MHEMEPSVEKLPSSNVASVVGRAPDMRIGEIEPEVSAQSIKRIGKELSRTPVDDNAFRSLRGHRLRSHSGCAPRWSGHSHGDQRNGNHFIKNSRRKQTPDIV